MGRRGSAFGPACNGMFLVAIAVTIAFASVGVASAATSVGPATWDKATPVDGSTSPLARPKVSVEAFDPAGIKQSSYSMSLDGVSVKPSFSYKLVGWNGTVPVVDKRYATLTMTLRSDVAYGSHALVANVANNASVSSSHAWSFTRAADPVLDVPVPARASVTTSRTPTLSVRVLSNSQGLAGCFLLDGVAVPATFDAATGVLSGTPSAGLPVGTHSVTVNVTNALAGSATLSWEFAVDLRLPMQQITTCASCHPDQPGAHDMTRCVACHGVAGPLGEGDVIGTPHSPYYIYAPEYDCDSCHTESFPDIPTRHAFAPDTYHDASTGLCSDAECHARSFDAEHNRNGMTCLTCHRSTDPRVLEAIESGSHECASCHPEKVDSGGNIVSHGFDPEQHTADDKTLSGTWPAVGDNATYNPAYAYSAACSECHELLLTDEHVKATGSSAADVCATCHPAPRSAFTSWDKSCTQAGCHTLAGTAHQASGTSHKMSSADITGGCGYVGSNGRRPCHFQDLVQEHNRSINTRIEPSTGKPVIKTLSTTCVECHTSDAFADLGGSWDGRCVSCHPENHTVVGTARYNAVRAKHDNPSGFYDNGTGASGSNAMDAHGPIRPEPDPYSPNKTTGCGVPTCHTQGYLGGGWPFPSTSCTSCHGPSIAVPDPYQGTHAWYSDNWYDTQSLDSKLTMTLDPITLPAGSSLDFKTWYDIERDWDYGYIQVSTDGGSTWTNVPGNITTNTDPNAQNTGNGITGTSGGWADAHFDLSSYAGRTVKIRFSYQGDFYVYGLGWMIDMITVGPPGAPVFADDAETLRPEWDVQTYVSYYEYDDETETDVLVTVPSTDTGWKRFSR